MHARVGTLRLALQAIAGMCADQYPNAQEQVERIHDRADEALDAERKAMGKPTAEQPEPRFMFNEQGNDLYGSYRFSTLSEMLDANRDDADFCTWLRTAEAGGAPHVAGGGAAPAFWTWRVS
jgi:hypothetical protein